MFSSVFRLRGVASSPFWGVESSAACVATARRWCVCAGACLVCTSAVAASGGEGRPVVCLRCTGGAEWGVGVAGGRRARLIRRRRGRRASLTQRFTADRHSCIARTDTRLDKTFVQSMRNIYNLRIGVFRDRHLSVACFCCAHIHFCCFKLDWNHIKFVLWSALSYWIALS